MAEKEYIFEKTVYLLDTTIYGNVYFARYFEWQGMAREALFREVMGENSNLFQSGIKLVTIEASIKYSHEAALFDTVMIKIKPANIKITTFDLIFMYINKKTGDLVAEGRQRIGFVDSTNKVIPIPNELREGWIKFKGQ